MDLIEPQELLKRSGTPTPHQVQRGFCWSDTFQALADPSLDPLFWRAERLGAESAWWEHVPFAHWIVCATSPRVLVELGTHTGVSYTAFCHAVARAELGTRCHAVDTWQGDPHAGHYGPEVLSDLRRFHDERFGAFSTLLQCTFDEALGHIEDGSIDLLHIDGLHTYEAVRQDFGNWLPKLSERAVVLFHDTNVRREDFGVWRLWAELRKQYSGFDFMHGHGLGVLAIGADVPAPVAALCQLSDPAAIAMIRTRFARLGERWCIDTRERLLAQGIGQHVAATDQLRAEAAKWSSEAADLRAKVMQREAEAEQLRAEVAQHNSEAEAARQTAERSAEQLKTALATGRERQLTELRKRAERAEAAGEAAVSRVVELGRLLAETEAERDRVRYELADVLRSTFWRITEPARRAASALPRGVRRQGRRGARFAYWLLTPHRTRERIAYIRARSARLRLSPPAAVDPPPSAPPQGNPGAADQRVSVLPAAGRPSWVYISGEPDTPGHQYRVMRPAAAARVSGIRTSWMRPEEIPDRIGEIEAADALLIWRAAWDERIAAAVDAARRGGAKVVFDVDDLMVVPDLARTEVIDGIRTQCLTEEAVRDHYSRVRATMTAADLCLATTDELAQHMRRMFMPSVVFPNGVDHETIIASRLAARRRKAQPDDGLIRIGYAGGSRTHQRDFAVCAASVADALRTRPAARLVAFYSAGAAMPCLDIGEFPELHGLESQIEWREVVPLERLPEELARFDINLAPLETDNPFCEAKSELKLFEAALVDVPTIASPTGPFRRAIRHGKTGFLAGTPGEWQVALTKLLDDAQLRRGLARAAGREALWRFGPERRAMLTAVLADLLHGGRRAAVAFAQEICRADAPLPKPNVPDHEVVFQVDRLGAADVTVVIPLHNYAEYIVEALESVHAQTLAALDLIVVDDQSSDDSLQVALNWLRRHAGRFNRVVLLRNNANSGLAHTRNVGFDWADTPWVLPLDADNRLLPDCAAECLRVAQQSGAAFIYPVIEQFGAASGLIGNIGYDPVRLSNGNYIDAMALISRAAWICVGGYRHVDGGWEDFDIWCRMAECGFWGERVASRPLAGYRVHPTSMIKTAYLQPEIVYGMINKLNTTHHWLRLIEDPSSVETAPADCEPILSSGETTDYNRWLRETDLSDQDRQAIRAHIALLKIRPAISVVMATYDTNEQYLRQAIGSVRSQLYPHWELCIADDASPAPHVTAILEEAAAQDERIKWARRETNGHIAEAMNTALALATGHFIALMDHDDMLAEHALYEIAGAINTHPDADLIYSDVDEIDEMGRRHSPYFKPDWNYDLFLGHNVVCHLDVYRRSLVEQLGGFRVGFEGSQDYDLALRVVAATSSERIHHVPAVLYHWRRTGQSSFSELNLDRCTDAARRAIGEHLCARAGAAAAAEVVPHPTIPEWNRIRWPLPSPPRATIIVPTRDRADLLAQCASGVLHRTDYPDIELIVVDNDSVEAETEVLLRELARDPRVRVTKFTGPFNYSAINNFAAGQATGAVVVLLNNDTIVMNQDWLHEIISHLMRPDVGAVGAKLLYQDHTIQHAGIVLGIGVDDRVAWHLGEGKTRDDPGYFGQFALTRELSACTGACLALRRAVYREVGGLDEENLPIAYNDVDLCLRIRQRGYKIVWTPFAELCHIGSASRGLDVTPDKAERLRRDIDYMRARWGVVLDHDPFYNPNFSRSDPDFRLGLPPSRPKPWHNDASRGAVSEAEPEPSRSEILLAPIPPAGKILEVGASFSPVAPKSAGWNTKTLDHSAREGLIAKYAGHPGVDVDRIEEVDFVWSGGKVCDAVPSDQWGSFDGFIASHVIEHTPDLISFLNSIEVLLKRDGVAALAIPDKRYCFDYFRPLSTTGQVLAARWEGRAWHSPARAFDYAAYSAVNEEAIAWGQHPTKGLRLVNSPEMALGFAREVGENNNYVDMHAWCFVPASFELLLLELAMLGETDLRVERITPSNSCEFLCWLRCGGKAVVAMMSAAERTDARSVLLKRAMLETRTQVDWLLAGEPGLEDSSGIMQQGIPALQSSESGVPEPSQPARKEASQGGHPILPTAVVAPEIRQLDQRAKPSSMWHGAKSSVSPDPTRLRSMLPLLRCPETGQPLRLCTDGDALISEDGSRRWPLVMGRPLLFPGLEAPIINSNEHLSNPLPTSALAMIHNTSGPILHLSAGGTIERFDHVIEAEAAVFRNTDLICDVHRLPFDADVFDAVLALNAFEHYRDPRTAAREIWRVLRPGGRVLIHTAFLQPLHEAPWHFFNCTRYGLEAWFEGFDIEKLSVSENFHAGYSLSWLASECETALRSQASEAEADQFLATPLQRIVSLWRAPEKIKIEEPLWSSLAALPQEVQEGLAAGFELLARRPA